MNIGIDISPISTDSQIQHSVRGVGFYLKHLKDALESYVTNNAYTYFTQEEPLVEPVDIIHYPYFDPFFPVLQKRKKLKTVVTVHDLTPIVFPKHFPAGIRGNLHWLSNKRLLENVDGIITDSYASKKDIEHLTKISPDKIHVVYLAAGEEFKQITVTREEKERLTKKYNLPDNFVMTVGDVTWNKNLPRFIRAMQSAELPTVMVGKTLVEHDFDQTNPWNSDLVESQTLLQSRKNIHALGFVPTADLILLYNLATVFVMPSLYEGFGLPILEAMACGCPVVTTREGSLPEVAGDAAIYCDAYSTESIAKIVKELFQSKKNRQDFSQHGLKQIKRFSWKKTALETAAVYNLVK